MKTALWAIGIMFMNTLITAVGALLLKLGAMQLAQKEGKKEHKEIWKLWKHHLLFFGLSLYGIASILGIYAYKGGDLNKVFPIAALTYIWTMVLSVKYLKEPMNPWKWAAIVFIVIGVSFVFF